MSTCEGTPQVDHPVANLNLKAYRGDTFNHTFVWKDSDGNPIDLTGYSARMMVRKDHNSPILLDWVSGIHIGLGGEAGTIQIIAKSEANNEFNVYDLELTDPSLQVTTLVTGEYHESPDVTHDN